MNIYILRHGIAAERTVRRYSKDAERPLTPKGKRKLRRITEAMDRLGLSFDLIVTSPYVRARQTAEIVVEALGLQRKLELCEALTPTGRAANLIDFINNFKPSFENVLLVGHEPYLSRLVSLLLSGSSDLSVALKKAGLCKLTTDELQPGRCACLHWLLTPKQMVAMS